MLSLQLSALSPLEPAPSLDLGHAHSLVFKLDTCVCAGSGDPEASCSFAMLLLHSPISSPHVFICFCCLTIIFWLLSSKVLFCPCLSMLILHFSYPSQPTDCCPTPNMVLTAVSSCLKDVLPPQCHQTLPHRIAGIFSFWHVTTQL